MKKKKDIIKEINDYLGKYFKLMDAGEVDFNVYEEEGAIKVNLKTGTENAGLLIGNKGKNLYSLQAVIRSTFQQALEGKKLFVDVDNWRGKEEDRLKNVAKKAADRARETLQPQTLYNLTPSQRRIIHIFLSEEKDITTESFGEDKDRYLVVSPKK